MQKQQQHNSMIMHDVLVNCNKTTNSVKPMYTHNVYELCFVDWRGITWRPQMWTLRYNVIIREYNLNLIY